MEKKEKKLTDEDVKKRSRKKGDCEWATEKEKSLLTRMWQREVNKRWNVNEKQKKKKEKKLTDEDVTKRSRKIKKKSLLTRMWKREVQKGEMWISNRKRKKAYWLGCD